MSLSHSWRGKSGSVLQRLAMKWSLNVCIALSAELRWCECGGMSW